MTTAEKPRNRTVEKPADRPNAYNPDLLKFSSIAFEPNNPVQNNIVRGLEAVNMKAEMKLSTRPPASTTGSGLFSGFKTVCMIIIAPKTIKTPELDIPKTFLIRLFSSNFPTPAIARRI